MRGGKICLVFIIVLDVISFGVCFKDSFLWEELSRVLNYWIGIEMFLFMTILILFMN